MKTNPIAVPSARSLALALLVSLAGLPAGAAVFDDFESYAVGSNLHGQGGWSGWAGNPGAGAVVSTSFSFSPTRAVNVTGATDLVRTFSGVTNGQWVFKVMQYIPATSSGTNYVILLNRYRPPFTATDLNWSVQFQNNLNTGQIISDLGGGATRPMVKNQWVEIRVEINLASNTVAEFYNGQPLSTHVWQDGTGLNELQAFDLYAADSGPVYYDNVSLTPAPPADAPATALRISNTGPNLEGLPTFKLEWDAISNATYLVQSADSLAPGSPWTTLDLVIVPDKAGSYVFDLVVTDSIGLSSPSKFFRLILPQPKIFSVEPAVFPPGVPVDAYVIGQCFETNDVVRVDGVPLSGLIYLSHNMLQGPLPTLSVGSHLVELVRGGVVQSSFTVTCADPFVNPELVLQEPPDAPPASPQAGTRVRKGMQDIKSIAARSQGVKVIGSVLI